MQEKNEEFKSLAEASDYAHISRVAVYTAIRKGNLKAEKRRHLGKFSSKRMQWAISKEDLDEYRRNKFSRERRMYNGERLYDLEQDKWGVLHAAKTLGEMLERPYNISLIYYRIRRGEIRARKHGKHWVITKEEIIKIYEKELRKTSEEDKEFG